MREFQSHLLPKPRGVEWKTPTGQELDLEIGAGQGLHAIRYCQMHPNRTLIAVEKTHNRFKALKRRAEAHALDNLRPVHADAIAFAVHCLPDQSLGQIFLLYPNPYPKINQRWHNRPAIVALLSKLKPHGRLVMATNLKWLAREAAVNFVRNWPLQLIGFEQVCPSDPPRTHFEKKYLARQEACWNLEFQLLPTAGDGSSIET